MVWFSLKLIELIMFNTKFLEIMATTKNPTGQSNSGSKSNFANIDEKKQKEMASKGGKASRSNSNNDSRSHR